MPVTNIQVCELYIASLVSAVQRWRIGCKKYEIIRNRKRPCSQRKQMTTLNWMKCGHLNSKWAINTGCGQFCVVGREKPLLMWLEIVARKPVENYRNSSQKNIKIVAVTVISRKLTRKFFRKKPIGVSKRKLARRVTWSVGTLSCANQMPDTCEGPYHSPKAISTIRLLRDSM